MDRWVTGIIGAFAVVVFVNGLFIYLALDNPVQVEPSYLQEAR